MDSSTLRSSIEILSPPDPICVSSNAPVKDVLDTMRTNRIGCVCVVENGELVGIFTERDVLKRVVNKDLELQSAIISQVMTPDPEYLYKDDDVAFALNRMHVGGFRHVPLLGLDGQPAGVISIKDIVAFLVKNLKDVKS